LNGVFLRKLAIIHYESKYNPPRKAFDFYTATALVWFMKDGSLPLAPRRRMFYSNKYGLTLVSEGDTWAWARNSYVSRINTKLDPEDSEFERTKKENFQREISFMQELQELPHLMVGFGRLFTIFLAFCLVAKFLESKVTDLVSCLPLGEGCQVQLGPGHQEAQPG
jgi:hypothetical protein